MPALIIIAAAGYAGLCAFALAAFVLAGRADDSTEAWGDIPHLPEGVAATRDNSGGGRSCKQAAAGESHSHIQTSSVSHSGQGAK